MVAPGPECILRHREQLKTDRAWLGMCGFVCAYSKSPEGKIDAATLGRMDRALAHRGPDGQATHHGGRVAMAHRRLAVIDLSGGQQPMSASEGRVWMVFNGEIFNYREVRAQLVRGGCGVEGASDTEVLLKAYMHWGEACLWRLNGMFAFVIWDGRDQSLFAARDRFGEKPLYIAETATGITFASELKALVQGGLVEKRIDPLALYDYFTSTFIKSPRTIFRGVQRLPAGHSFHHRAGGSEVRRWWAPPVPVDELTDERSIVGRVQELLTDAVRARMVADVPVGFFLSGGVDSSAVVAAAAEVSGSPLQTFTIGFEDGAFDEREAARYVARKYGTEHHEFVVRPADLECLQDIVWHADEPFGDPSALAVWHLSSFTRKHVTVALSGDGADEMFAGYDSYRGHVLSEQLRRFPRVLRDLAVRYYPRDFLWQKKRGFVPPLASWFKSDLAGHIRQRLLAPGSLSQALFRRECLEIILGEHRTLERDWSSALWALLIFEEWCLRFGITADALEFGGT